MSGLVAMQQQEFVSVSVARITIKGHVDGVTFLAWGAAWDHELTLALTDCSTRESRPCTLPEQYSRDGSGGIGTGKPALKAQEWENSPCPLASAI